MAVKATTLVRWAARLFGGEIAERVFAPLVADWQHERRRGTNRAATARIDGASAGLYASWGLAGDGDMDGDGIDDLAVGGPGYDCSTSDCGPRQAISVEPTVPKVSDAPSRV